MELSRVTIYSPIKKLPKSKTAVFGGFIRHTKVRAYFLDDPVQFYYPITILYRDPEGVAAVLNFIEELSNTTKSDIYYFFDKTENHIRRFASQNTINIE